MTLAALALAAFIIGSIPVGLIIANAKGVDIRKRGSGNIGATNVLRTIGKKEGLITLIGDMLKGLIPVIVAWKVTPGNMNTGIVGLAAVAGHDFSLFLKFRGGKGVATSLGVLLGFSPVTGLVTIGIWLIIFAITKVSSLSALIAFMLLPLNMYLIDDAENKIVISLVITLLIFIKHRENIKRLIKGEESGIGQKA